MCNAANGTWPHAVIDCHMSKCVCALMDDNVVEHMMACGSDDAKLWLSKREEESCRTVQKSCETMARRI